MTTRSLFFVLGEIPDSEDRHKSIALAVMSSSGRLPKAGRRWALRVER
jgi:hypothetical protein